jgi:hypothetical protein
MKRAPLPMHRLRACLAALAPPGALFQLLGERGPMHVLGRTCFDHGEAVLLACDLRDRGYSPRIAPWKPRGGTVQP